MVRLRLEEETSVGSEARGAPEQAARRARTRLGASEGDVKVKGAEATQGRCVKHACGGVKHTAREKQHAGSRVSSASAHGVSEAAADS